MKIFSSKAMLATTGLTLVFVAGACAKRPVVPVASAPPPQAAPAPAAAPEAPAPPPTVVAAPAPQPETRPASKEFRPNDALKTIHFAFDKSNIRPPDAKILEANAAWLKANPNYLLLIEGHCDERGTSEYNLALGDRRAAATMQYLARQGVQSDRMSVISYGLERPLCTAHNEECWAQNRRAQFLVKEQ